MWCPMLSPRCAGAVVVAMLSFCSASKAQSEPRLATTRIPFTGTASGGVLILGDTLNRNALHVSISTRKGETADTVAARFVEALREAASRDPDHSWWPVSAAGGSLEGLLGFDCRGDYFLAGTEIGLGIPSPPLFLTCCYNEDQNSIHVKWENPPGGYGSVAIVLNWQNYDYRSLPVVEGAGAEHVIRLNRDTPHPIDINDVDVWVVGYRNNIPSNAAAMHVSGRSQEELFGIPFRSNIAPNWASWSTSTGRVRPEQKVRNGYLNNKYPYNPVSSAKRKPFVQVIRSPNARAAGGVFRKFLGLQPGHTYRTVTRMSTFDLEKAEGNWSFTFHATAHKRGVTLSAEQMAGISPLPDGSEGPEAALVAKYGPGTTTRGRFAERSSGEQAGGLQLKDITLPSDAEVITVWFRYSGPPSGSGGFDWISLKDITAQ